MKAKEIKDKKVAKRLRRHKKIRSRIHGTSARPRIAVFRSLRYIYVQAIDDDAGKTLASASDMKIKKGTKSERAAQVGKEIADKLKSMKIDEAVFDRGGFKYDGRIKILADSAREAGLRF